MAFRQTIVQYMSTLNRDYSNITLTHARHRHKFIQTKQGNIRQMDTNTRRRRQNHARSHAIAVASQQEIRPLVAGSLVAVLAIWLTAAATITAMVAS